MAGTNTYFVVDLHGDSYNKAGSRYSSNEDQDFDSIEEAMEYLDNVRNSISGRVIYSRNLMGDSVYIKENGSWKPNNV